VPDTPDTIATLFQAGKIAPAIQAANAAVRKTPGDLGARILLAELLIISNNLERADVILDAAGMADPAATAVVAEFRQLLRAEQARRQLTADGRVPEFLGDPTPALRAVLAARVTARGGDVAEAARNAAEAEELRPRVPGILGTKDGETPIDDFRDIDDLCAGFFEVLTTTGKFYWIPTERVASIEFHAPKRPRDLVWRRATVSVIDGPDGEVYLPVIYEPGEVQPADEFRLGRATEWSDENSPPVRGTGQRVFLAGEDAIGIMDIVSLRFAP